MVSLFKTMGEAGLAMLLALILAGAAFIFRPALHPLVKAVQAVETESGRFAQEAAPSITLEEARTYFEAGTALFADARPLEAYQNGHILGAIHLDPNASDTWSENFFSQFPADTRIIAYCDGAQCPLSSELAEKLIWLGYEKVFVLKNGWSLWTAAQLPTEQVAQ